jgi:hypothetical protein
MNFSSNQTSPQRQTSQKLTPLFPSFFLGGFECSTHRAFHGRRLDLIEATEHDTYCYEDYQRLQELGFRMARDGVRWHLIEHAPYKYDFSSVLPMIRAANDAKVTIIWDLFHYGWPDDVDILKPEFVQRFVEFAKNFAALLVEETDLPQWFTPINEPSFFSWAAGEKGIFFPYLKEEGGAIKAQVIRAGLAAMHAIKQVHPEARFAAVDPLIHVVPNPNKPEEQEAAWVKNESQFESWDFISGRKCPELGGNPEDLALMGLNFYCHNQWLFGTEGSFIRRWDPLYRPLRELLQDVYQRYETPLFLAETGIEDEDRPTWFRYVCQEVWAALELGVPVHGICLYPIVNHPGWDDDRHCYNGLWDYPNEVGERDIYRPLAEEIIYWQARFEGEENPLFHFPAHADTVHEKQALAHMRSYTQLKPCKPPPRSRQSFN